MSPELQNQRCPLNAFAECIGLACGIWHRGSIDDPKCGACGLISLSFEINKIREELHEIKYALIHLKGPLVEPGEDPHL